jgi:surface antigen
MATTSKNGDKPEKPAAKAAAKPKTPKSVKETKATSESAVKKPAAKKAAAPKKAAAKKAVTVTSKPATVAKTRSGANLTPEQRRYYVEVAAYYIAERRGFQGGSQLEDWANAEAEIDRLLREGILKP